MQKIVVVNNIKEKNLKKNKNVQFNKKLDMLFKIQIITQFIQIKIVKLISLLMRTLQRKNLMKYEF